MQQPVCIVIAARKRGKDAGKPARLRFRALPEGRREEKFAALGRLSLDDAGWVEGADGWREAFLPEATGLWAEFPALVDLFVYDGSGVMPGRTWVIAPDKQTLAARWQRLHSEPNLATRELLFHPHEGGDKTLAKTPRTSLSGHEQRMVAVKDDTGQIVTPARYAFRSFDRQWIIPDARLINRPNPALWDGYSDRQVLLTALDVHSPSSGPAVTLCGLVPDLHHYKGSFGGRAFPLWRNAAATQSNVTPAVLAALSEAYGASVTPEPS